jgi:hypothetical protein
MTSLENQSRRMTMRIRSWVLAFLVVAFAASCEAGDPREDLIQETSDIEHEEDCGCPE